MCLMFLYCYEKHSEIFLRMNMKYILKFKHLIIKLQSFLVFKFVVGGCSFYIRMESRVILYIDGLIFAVFDNVSVKWSIN